MTTTPHQTTTLECGHVLHFLATPRWKKALEKMTETRCPTCRKTRKVINKKVQGELF